MTSKTVLREQLLRDRSAYVEAMAPADRARCFTIPPTPLLAYFQPGTTVAGYLPMRDEADPLRLMAAARAIGCVVALPRVTARVAPMRFHLWDDDDTLEQGPFGLRQPAAEAPLMAPDIVLTPLLGFDRSGGRLGQGAGYYDRALSLLPDAIRIGIGWSAQELPAVPVDPWDQPLDAILTEREWIVP